LISPIFLDIVFWNLIRQIERLAEKSDITCCTIERSNISKVCQCRNVVKCSCRDQFNFHAFYYFYDGLETSGRLKKYCLPDERRLRYLRITDRRAEKKRAFQIRNAPRENAIRFKELIENLTFLDMGEYCETIWKILAVILILGEIRFVENGDGEVELNDNEAANRGKKIQNSRIRRCIVSFTIALRRPIDRHIAVAELLGLDQTRFLWALVNYCLIRKGSVIRRRYTYEEAKEMRDILANTLYQRLVDWIVNIINYKLSITRSL